LKLLQIFINSFLANLLVSWNFEGKYPVHKTYFQERRLEIQVPELPLALGYKLSKSSEINLQASQHTTKGSIISDIKEKWSGNLLKSI